MILLARGTCGIGFIGLCVNALLPEPSLLAIYLLGLWDGFFASLGVTALLAATPALVGRENLMQAGAITMLTVRLGSVISRCWGHIACQRRRSSNYGLAAAGTFITLLPLLTLPRLPVPPQPRKIHLLRYWRHFVFARQSAYRRYCAAWRSGDDGKRGTRPLSGAGDELADVGGANRFAVCGNSAGAAIGALTSGQLAHSVRPGLIMLVSTVGSFLAVGLFAIMPVWIAGVICLALFGWLSAISSLLQYTLLQTQTPENMLGRMNGLWTAQNVTGDAIGAALLGGLGAMMTPVASASVSGFGLVIIGLLLLLVLGELRRFRQTPPVSDAG